MNQFKLFSVIVFLLSATYTNGQTKKNGSVSIGFTNNQTAYPFEKFSGLFTKEFHPGFELGYSINWKTKQHHDWFQDFIAGYFYHRFIQHAIPIYTRFGYRYKLKHLNFSTGIGAGYLHSIPDAAVYKLNSDGNYENGKGLGRGQATINFMIGTSYGFQFSKTRHANVFLHYQQQLQTPFIKSYVPLLPYNSIVIGISSPLKK